jgi:hypothetical protein
MSFPHGSSSQVVDPVGNAVATVSQANLSPGSRALYSLLARSIPISVSKVLVGIRICGIKFWFKESDLSKTKKIQQLKELKKLKWVVVGYSQLCLLLGGGGIRDKQRDTERHRETQRDTERHREKGCWTLSLLLIILPSPTAFWTWKWFPVHKHLLLHQHHPRRRHRHRCLFHWSSTVLFTIFSFSWSLEVLTKCFDGVKMEVE